MKIKSILASALTLLMLVACSDSDLVNSGGGDDSDTEFAYLSLKILTPSATRASEEENGTEAESKITTLYLITFDNSGRIVPAPGTNNYFIKVDNPANVSLDPVKVSVKAQKLLLVANPGTKLHGVINSINATTTFGTVNSSIQSATMQEITDNVADITKGFTMINSGDETGKSSGDFITDPLIPITDKIKKVADYSSEAEAKQAAENDKAQVKIERLASKLEFKVKSQLTVKPQGASFVFSNWTLDAVNTEFYPFAEKTLLSVLHDVNNGSYVKNFYTEDPNFNLSDSEIGKGLQWGTVDADTYDPILPAPYQWMVSDEKTYSIENTVAAAQQKYGNVTRVVIKGKYYPDAAWTGDWFNFAGINYKTLADLQAAYDAAADNSNLKAACDKMYNHIKNYAIANSITLVGQDFETLKEEDLDKISNGGEVLKDGVSDVIRWYQKGLSYYYYQIIHDNETTQDMSFGKYGVVRNNWYSLTLGTINGPGTPWYPDIDNPGPGDPDPVDPIDESGGFLGVEVEIAPWIIWKNEIEI